MAKIYKETNIRITALTRKELWRVIKHYRALGYVKNNDIRDFSASQGQKPYCQVWVNRTERVKMIEI